MTLIDLLNILQKYDIEVVIRPESNLKRNVYSVELIKRRDRGIYRECFYVDLNGVCNPDELLEWLFDKNIIALHTRVANKNT